MIQLANDPHSSRSFPRAANDDRTELQDARRVRSGHPWPFLSRYAAPTRKESSEKPAANDSGS